MRTIARPLSRSRRQHPHAPPLAHGVLGVRGGQAPVDLGEALGELRHLPERGVPVRTEHPGQTTVYLGDRGS